MTVVLVSMTGKIIIGKSLGYGTPAVYDELGVTAWLASSHLLQTLIPWGSGHLPFTDEDVEA